MVSSENKTKTNNEEKTTGQILIDHAKALTDGLKFAFDNFPCTTGFVLYEMHQLSEDQLVGIRKAINKKVQQLRRDKND